MRLSYCYRQPQRSISEFTQATPTAVAKSWVRVQQAALATRICVEFDAVESAEILKIFHWRREGREPVFKSEKLSEKNWFLTNWNRESLRSQLVVAPEIKFSRWKPRKCCLPAKVLVSGSLKQCFPSSSRLSAVSSVHDFLNSNKSQKRFRHMTVQPASSLLII